jgi:hypothetical protein
MESQPPGYGVSNGNNESTEHFLTLPLISKLKLREALTRAPIAGPALVPAW